MHKFFRILESVQKIFKKPFHGAERRISISPIVNNLFQDEEQRLHSNPHVAAYAQVHKKYLDQINSQIGVQRRQAKYISKQEYGLTELLLPHKQLLKQKMIFLTGDFQVRNGNHFVHTIQLGRQGADTFYWSLDDIETTASRVTDDHEYQMDDSFVFQQ